MTTLQEIILDILRRHPGLHFTGPSMAAMANSTPRNIRTAIRSLRFDHGCWDILSRAGDDPATDGYWLSTNKKEIAENRKYHEHYGRSNLARASRMVPEKSEHVSNAAGQMSLFEELA
jgi:hypothetical protein